MCHIFQMWAESHVAAAWPPFNRVETRRVPVRGERGVKRYINSTRARESDFHSLGFLSLWTKHPIDNSLLYSKLLSPTAHHQFPKQLAGWLLRPVFSQELFTPLPSPRSANSKSRSPNTRIGNPQSSKKQLRRRKEELPLLICSLEWRSCILVLRRIETWWM